MSRAFSFCGILLVIAACSPGDGAEVVSPPQTVAGRPSTPAAGAGGSAGAAVTGRAGTMPAAGGAGASAVDAGAALGGAGASGAPVAGAAAVGGGAGTAAGSGGAGSAGGAGVIAGGSTGRAGSAGSAGSAADGGVGTAMPSPGCAKLAGRPAGGAVMQNDRIYSFPASYDGKAPMPLLLALHAAGNPNTQLQNITRGSKLETEYVRVFPKSSGSAWSYATDAPKVSAVLDDVLANYCIDTQRIFATGHSSGAQMIVQLLCNGEKRFKGVAPVAASRYCAKFSPVAALYIQGMMDAQRGGKNGADVVDSFATSNACSSMTTPKADVASCTSTFDRMQVTPGCVTYAGCMTPTVWCSHNDNGYNNTDGRQHGWPCFANAAIAEFFSSLP